MPVANLISIFAGDRAADTALASLGMATAAASVVFAGYMMIIGPQSGAQPGHDIGAGEAVPARAPPREDAPLSLTSGPGAIDFTPTGTLPSVREPSAALQPMAVLRDFAVRDVFDGTALVESHGALHMVGPGDRLEGAGTVVAIERRGRGWIVRTSAGIIHQRR